MILRLHLTSATFARLEAATAAARDGRMTMVAAVNVMLRKWGRRRVDLAPYREQASRQDRREVAVTLDPDTSGLAADLGPVGVRSVVRWYLDTHDIRPVEREPDTNERYEVEGTEE